MKNRLFLKLLAIGLLGALLCIPLLMIESTIARRAQYRETAISDIARSDAGAQSLNGPVLVIPYRIGQWKVTDAKAGVRMLEWNTYQLRLLPRQLTVSGALQPDQRKRGIFRATVYSTQLDIAGDFDVPANFNLNEKYDEFELLQPYVAVGVADIRGIKASPELLWNAQAATFEPGSQLPQLGAGIHANVSGVTLAGGRMPFKFKLALAGMDRLDVTPLGRDTDITLTSPWPHPSFGGQFLPTSRQVSAQGFEANWHTSWFSTNAKERFDECISTQQCGKFQTMQLGVRLMDPVDNYLMSERSVKYGFLFVFLTFGAFFLFEVLKRLAVHPVQYGLVGMALAMFFLLLVSLSEHIAFALAYAIAAAACVGLTSFYVMHVLQSTLRGLSFGAMLATLYGLLFMLLQSEDYALLLGSSLLFGLLALAMLITRKIDWYQLGGGTGSENGV